ncbi:helix-turn-helix transcriptional regulator [Streptomyces sp. NBC_00306]|uniref:helix-turn-helix transcriptional regulator n=1 Tax=Streptomyces sp. NBC_00306 TaxID=2975708 RepID=UPI002E287CF6|nr:LuxR C-terminal-related transcriptional regulator [Streptomyces sp. NBC_00306]
MTGRTPARHSLRLYGRTTELAALAALADRVRSGRGAALVLAAEPGLGRTALLERAVRDTDAGTVLQVRAARAERDLSYSGVNSLLAGAPPQLDPPGEVPPACTSPTGLLDALRRGDAREPLLVCVDDAHLWDAASRAALGYAARRAGSLPAVGLLMSVAAHRADAADFAGLPVVRLGPLAEEAAATLVDELAEELTGGPADPDVRASVLHEAMGNPALLFAVVRRLSAAQLAGHAPLPRPLADGAALVHVVGSRLDELPLATRQLLLLVAAAQEQDPDGAGADATLLMRAARAAGLDPAALDAAEAAGVTRSAGNRIRFDDPLLLRAVLSGAALSRRRAAHRLLAAVLGGERHRLPRLLHRALAADGPDPALAACLAAAADSPDVRATPLERSVAFGRAARLTPPGSARTSRLTAAAEHAWFAGDPGRARDLLAAGRQESAHDAVRGCAELVRGTLALHDGPVGDAYEILMLAAALLGPYDQERMLTARLGATEAAWSAGDVPACLVALGGAPRTAPAPGEESPTGERAHPELPARWRNVRQSAETVPDTAGPDGLGANPSPLSRTSSADSRAAAGSSPTEFRTPAAWAPGDRAERPGGDGDLFQDYRAGMLHALGARLDEARRPLRRVLDRAATDHDPARLVRAGVAALVLGNIAAACHVNARALAAARARNLVPLVPQILEHLAYAELRAGRHARARAHAEEGLRAAHRTGRRNSVAHHHAILALAASVEGDGEAVAAHAEAALAIAGPHGLAQAATLAEWARARADLGRGRAADAAARLGPLVRPGHRRGHFAVRMLAVPCYVEAAVLAGEPEDTATAVEEFAVWAAQGADPQAPAQLSRCRALLASAQETEALYDHALVRHELAGGDFERARTLLLYGKWLRRRRRLREARGRLRDALFAFERSGALVWAEQTRAELRATGGAGPREQQPGPLACLTPQQLRIARCVADGATNREVALQLSVSPRTVDHHLRNVFALLGVRSRVELSRLVDQAEKNRPDP